MQTLQTSGEPTTTISSPINKGVSKKDLSIHKCLPLFLKTILLSIAIISILALASCDDSGGNGNTNTNNNGNGNDDDNNGGASTFIYTLTGSNGIIEYNGVPITNEQTLDATDTDFTITVPNGIDISGSENFAEFTTSTGKTINLDRGVTAILSNGKAKITNISESYGTKEGGIIATGDGVPYTVEVGVYRMTATNDMYLYITDATEAMPEFKVGAGTANITVTNTTGTEVDIDGSGSAYSPSVIKLSDIIKFNADGTFIPQITNDQREKFESGISVFFGEGINPYTADDFDGDGVSHVNELAAGLDPTVDNSAALVFSDANYDDFPDHLATLGYTKPATIDDTAGTEPILNGSTIMHRAWIQNVCAQTPNGATTIGLKSDMDADGLSACSELILARNANDATDVDDDTDGDGITDFVEITQWETDPTGAYKVALSPAFSFETANTATISVGEEFNIEHKNVYSDGLIIGGPSSFKQGDYKFTFTTDNAAVATAIPTVIDSTKITAIAPGTAIITISRAEDDNFFAIIPLTFTVTVTGAIVFQDVSPADNFPDHLATLGYTKPATIDNTAGTQPILDGSTIMHRAWIQNVCAQTPNGQTAVSFTTDADSDGLSACSELILARDDNEATDANGDADGDGITDLVEVATWKTDPTGAYKIDITPPYKLLTNSYTYDLGSFILLSHRSVNQDSFLTGGPDYFTTADQHNLVRTSNRPEIVEITATKAKGIAVGTAIITISRAEDDNFNAITPLALTVTVVE